MSANCSRARNRIATKPSQRFGTPTVECPRAGDVRKYASAEERTTVCHFGFTEKVYGLPCTATAAINAEEADRVVTYDQGCKAQESSRCKVIYIEG